MISRVDNIQRRECLALYRAVYNDCVKSKDFPPHNSVVPSIHLRVTNHLPTRPLDNFVHIIIINILAMIGATYGRAGNCKSLSISMVSFRPFNICR